MRSLLCAVLAASFMIACVPPADEVCATRVELLCERFHECVPEGARDETWQFGPSVEACQTAFEAALGCEDIEDHDVFCEGDPNGSTWKAMAASKCADAQREMECADWLAMRAGDTSKTPEICNEMCVD